MSFREFKIEEDRNKIISVMVHYKKMMDTIFSTNKSVGGLIKDSIAVSYSITNSDNSTIGGISGWIAYDFAIIEAIWIETSSLKNGLGKMLLNKFEEKAREHNCCHILTSSNNVSDSLGFWQKSGFKILHTLKTKETGFTIYYLQKNLDS